MQKTVRDLILATFPQLEPDDVRSTPTGVTGEDIQLSPAARKVLPVQIECKNKATSQIHTYYNQAKQHGNYEPIVVVKKDHDIPLAVMRVEYFLSLLKNANQSKI